MNRNLQAPDNATTASLSTEHQRLIELLEHVRQVILVKNDLPAIRSALDELDEYGRWEFGLEEAAFDHPRPEDRASHHQEHAVLLEKLRDLRRAASIAGWSACKIPSAQTCTIVSRTGWCMGSVSRLKRTSLVLAL